MINVFLTGATGYVGSRILQRLVSRGHRVTALCRRATMQRALEAQGANVLLGDLSEPASYAALGGSLDAVIHAGFQYGADGAECGEIDRLATRALLTAQAQARSDEGARVKAFIYTSSLFLLASAATSDPIEECTSAASGWRLELEREVLAQRTSRTAIIRPGWVYGDGAGTLLEAFKPDERYRVAHPNEGTNRLPLVHVRDLAMLYSCVLEHEAHGVFHAVDTVLETREVARAIATSVGVADVFGVSGIELERAFGSAAALVSLDVPATATRSRALGWLATQPTRSLSAALSEPRQCD